MHNTLRIQDSKYQERLLVAHLGIAKSEFSEIEMEKIDPSKVQHYLNLVLEVVPIELLADKLLIKHALHCLVEEQTIVEIVLHIFMLAIYKQCSEGSNHPLEKGIVRQKIISLIPRFKAAFEQGLIRNSYFYPKRDALMSIADSQDNENQIMALLSKEYQRLRG